MSTTKLLCVIIAFAAFEELLAPARCQECKILKENSVRERLHTDLFCKYNPMFGPTAPTTLTVSLDVRSVSLISSTLIMDAVLNMWWHDPFLAWNPTNYENMKEVEVNSNSIWNPTITTVITMPWSRVGRYQKSLWPAACQVTFDGNVSCVSALEMGGTCFMDYLYWPHIRASCSSYIGQDYRTDLNVHAAYADNKTLFGDDIPDKGKEWKVTHIIKRYHSFKTPLLTHSTGLLYGINILRRGTVEEIVFVFPAIVMSIVMLASFYLPTTSIERYGLNSCAFIGIAYMSSYLFSILPPVGRTTPIIVSVYRDLLLLAGFIITLSVSLATLVTPGRKSLAAPRWLYTARTWLLETPGGNIALKILFLLPQKREANEAAVSDSENLRVPAEENNEESGSFAVESASSPNRLTPPGSPGPEMIWDFFVELLNRCAFYICFIINFALCAYLIWGTKLREFNLVNHGWESIDDVFIAD